MLAVSCLAFAGLAHAQTYKLEIKQFPEKGQSVRHAETARRTFASRPPGSRTRSRSAGPSGR